MLELREQHQIWNWQTSPNTLTRRTDISPHSQHPSPQFARERCQPHDKKCGEMQYPFQFVFLSYHLNFPSRNQSRRQLHAPLHPDEYHPEKCLPREGMVNYSRCGHAVWQLPDMCGKFYIGMLPPQQIYLAFYEILQVFATMQPYGRVIL